MLAKALLAVETITTPGPPRVSTRKKRRAELWDLLTAW